MRRVPTSLMGRLCCKTLFVSPNTDFPGRGCGKGILMWGTTSFCDELTDDFGGAFEATPIDDCRLFCRLAEILPHSVLGLLQHNQGQSGLERDGIRLNRHRTLLD